MPRADSTRLTLASGCSSVRVTFRDVGAARKWLHVSARRVGAQCTGDPDYPSCNLALPAISRRLLASPVSTDSTSLDNSLDADDVVNAPLDTFSGVVDTGGHRGRALARAGERSVDEGEAARDAAAGGADAGDSCEPNDNDDEDSGREDIDAGIDVSCSVFKVCKLLMFLKPYLKLSEPAARICQPCCSCGTMLCVVACV